MKVPFCPLGAGIAATLVFLVGCAGSPGGRQPDLAHAVLAAPEDQVRQAVLEVLESDGYSIQDESEPGRISTAYRQEISSIWDRLLVYRLGVNRSRVDATTVSEGESDTHLTIQVTYEAKSHIWSSWIGSSPALQQSAANLIRLVKNALRIL